MDQYTMAVGETQGYGGAKPGHLVLLRGTGPRHVRCSAPHKPRVERGAAMIRARAANHSAE